jgi:chemotaxis signal transduction protein
MTSGIRVDRVVDVADGPQDNIQPPPSNLSETLRPFVSGMLCHRDHTVTLLDMEGLFQAYLQGMG